MPNEKVYLSIIVPVYNEENNLPVFYAKAKAAIEEIGLTYEMIFINDGSEDGSLRVLEGINRQDKNARIINFRKNYGQTAALQAGFDFASGEVIITFDADLQNDPSDIKMLLDELDTGYDLVSGCRKLRKDKFLLRRLPSKFANWLINWLIASTKCHVHDYGCTLKAYRKWVVKSLNIYGEMHRFIPVFAALQGAKIGEVVVKHHPRLYGQSKYTLNRVYKVILDLITIRFFATSMTRPSHFFGKISGLMLFLGFGLSLFLFLISLFLDLGININTYLIINSMAISIAAQFIVLGLLGEIMMRSYFETTNKRPYTVKEII